MSVFELHYKKYDAWYEKNRFAYLSELEALKKVLPKDSKGLEVGVGTGRFAAALGITIGIDPSSEMLDLARQRGVNVRWGLGEDIPFWDDSFDYVAIIITLCFTKDPLKVLQESYRVIKKDGSIIIGIIDKDSFLGKYYQRKKSMFYKEANLFSVKEVSDFLKSAGFKNFSYYQTVFELPEKITAVERPKKGFGQGGFVIINATKS